MFLYMAIDKADAKKQETNFGQLLWNVHCVCTPVFGSTEKEVKDYLDYHKMSGRSKIKIVLVEMSEKDIIDVMQILASSALYGQGMIHSLKHIQFEII